MGSSEYVNTYILHAAARPARLLVVYPKILERFPRYSHLISETAGLHPDELKTAIERIFVILDAQASLSMH